MNPAIPIAVNGVAIDYLSPRPDEAHLAVALAAPPGGFIDPVRLVYMKLKASRMQDRADVVGLVKTGLDVDTCRAYLLTNAPEAAVLDPADKTAASHGRRTLGQWHGRVRMSDDFDAPLPPAELAAWLGERS